MARTKKDEVKSLVKKYVDKTKDVEMQSDHIFVALDLGKKRGVTFSEFLREIELTIEEHHESFYSLEEYKEWATEFMTEALILLSNWMSEDKVLFVNTDEFEREDFGWSDNL